jgi:D-alanine transfer protein
VNADATRLSPSQPPAADDQPDPSSHAELPHVVAAVSAAALFVLGLAAFSWYAERVVDRHIYQLAGSRYAQKDLGLVVQQAALRHTDLLPFFGTSEIDRLSRYHARDLFADAPTGFSVLTVARPGTPIFETMLNLGALGRTLRGRKVVISLSPPMFLFPDGFLLDQRWAANFSPVHTLTMLLDSALSPPLKQQLAQRLVERPNLLARNRVLEVVVRAAADGSATARLLHYALLPLAHLQRQLLLAQDRILVFGHIMKMVPDRAPARSPGARPLDWPALVADATAEFQARASANPFGVDDDWWSRLHTWAEAQRNTLTDDEFLRIMARSATWLDFEQLLRVLRELDAQALILSMPFYAPYMAHQGVSPAAYRQYYTRVQALADQYGVRTVIFDDHESDRFFFHDLWSHLSPRGWVYFDQALDAFYHDTLR